MFDEVVEPAKPDENSVLVENVVVANLEANPDCVVDCPAWKPCDAKVLVLPNDDASLFDAIGVEARL